MSIRADILQARLDETLGGALGQVAVGAAGQITLAVDAAAVVEVCNRKGQVSHASANIS
jgi:hypothetical protein